MNSKHTFCAAALTSTALLSSCTEPQEVGADKVFYNGAVYTSDDSRSWAEAVAITNGEIVFVGSDEAVADHVGLNTESTDLDGKMLLPGFHDGHAHVRYGGAASWGCSLQDAQDISVIRNLLVECVNARNYADDEWIVGGNWPLAAFPESGPTSAMLDEILGDRPAFFMDAFGHNAWVSSRALELAGIDSNTSDPPRGAIVRDAVTGEPTGTLRDSAMILVEELLPESTDEERYESLMEGLRRANAVGITAYIEPGASEPFLALYKTAEERGDLTARILMSLSPIDEMPDSFGPEIFDLLEKREKYRGKYVDVDSVKVYIDGVIETRTSYMLEPYSDGSNFAPFYAADELNQLYKQLDSMGLQIHTHAIGDGAIRRALDAYEHAFYANGENDNRHQIVHLQLIDDDDIPRFAELNVAANFQCMWCYPDVYIDLAVDIVGADRVNKFYPVKSIEDSGGLLVGGSDWDVSSLNPLDAIETSVRRQDPFAETGRVLGEGEEVSLTTALDMYTRNASQIMRLEKKTGSIEVGKRADLIVLDRNLFEIPTTEINEAQVLLGMMDGRVVYTAEDL